MHEAYHQQAQAMQRYYAVQSVVYDATRWAYLFGRKRVVSLIPNDVDPPSRILEVGCGTGVVTRALAQRFRSATITAYDASSHMARRARRAVSAFGSRVQVVRDVYAGSSNGYGFYDVALMSYSLSMMEPHASSVIQNVYNDLRPGGLIAVVDFDATPVSVFRSVMKANHVRLDGFMLPMLQERFDTIVAERHQSYGGWWTYLLFIGRKEQ